MMLIDSTTFKCHVTLFASIAFGCCVMLFASTTFGCRVMLFASTTFGRSNCGKSHLKFLKLEERKKRQ